VGFHTLIAEKRICKAYIAKDIVNGVSSGVNAHKILSAIAKRWSDNYRYHIFRISDSMRKKSELEKFIKEAGYIISFHDSRDRIKDIDDILQHPPVNHHFIFIKQFWKASKTLNDTYIGVCYEYTRDYTAAAQGLGGRLLGFGKQTGPQSPLLYCMPSIIEGYAKWFENDCNYLMTKVYNSSSLKIKDGKIIKQKKSAVNAENVENLTPKAHNQDQFIKEKKTYHEPKSMGPITMDQITNGEMGYIQLASVLETLSIDEFNYKLQKHIADSCGVTSISDFQALTNMPQTANELSKLLKKYDISANVSYSNNSAKSVSNLVNYYKHANWAESSWHIIYMPEVQKEIIIINRNKEILNNAKVDTVLRHIILRDKLYCTNSNINT
jgi:hypothetical protein